MFKIIRLLFSLAVIVAVVLIIKKSNGRKKWLTIIAGVLVFAIGSILMSELPPEKFLRTFSSPQEVFNYSQQGEIVKVIEGEKSAMVLYTDEGEKGQCLIPKGENGWQLETLSTFKTVYFKRSENTKCTITIFRITAIYELKPNNPQAIARGLNQLNIHKPQASSLVENGQVYLNCMIRG